MGAIRIGAVAAHFGRDLDFALQRITTLIDHARASGVSLLVLPPDTPAREAVFRTHLRDRPLEGVDVGALAKRTEGFSGADIAYVCEVAAERALMDSVASGTARLIGMPDLLDALTEVRPSTRSWLETARNVVLFGEDDGTYADLRAYLKKSKR